MAKSDLLLRVGLDPSAIKSGLQNAEKSLKRFGFKAESIGRDLTSRVSLPLIGIGAAAVKTFADFDRLEKGLSALNGSAAGGAASFNRLNKIVLDTRTTLDLKTAALGAQRLQGAGLSAAFAERTIKQLGIAATVSGSAIDDVGGVLRQFTQIIGKGKVEQEDLNSILDRMPALGALIKKEFGGVTAEAIRETGISMESFVSRLVTAIEVNDDFQGVQGGLAKSFESFGNAVQVGIRPLGKAISDALNLEKNLERLGNFVSRTSEAFANLNPNIQKFIIFSAGAAAAIGPVSFALGAAAKSLPLLASGFKLLAGPITKAAGLVSGLTSSFGLLFTGGTLGRAIVFSKAISGLKVALAALTGPIGLIIAGIGLVVVGFKRAFDGSAFFRNQIIRLQLSFGELGDRLGALVSKILPDLSGAFSKVGSVFNAVFSVIGGVISAVIESFILLIENVSTVADGITKLFSGDFSGAAKSFANSALNPLVFADQAKKVANAFAITFTETLDGKDLRIGSTSVAPNIGTGSQSVTDPAGPAKRSIKEIAALDLVPDDLSASARKEISEYFNEFVVGSRNVEFLQSKFDRLEIRPVEGVSNILRSKEVMTEVADEIRNNLGSAIDETAAKSIFFGQSYDLIGEQIKAVKDAMVVAYEEGFSPTDEIVIQLTESLNTLEQQQAKITEGFGAMSSSLDALKGVSKTAFDTVAQAMSKGESAVKAFGSAVLASVRDAIAAEIKLAVATQVASALKSVPFPFNVGLAAAAGAGASALFASALGALNIPALAKGGVTTGPQLALIGEAGPEAVVPLDRLESMINMGGGSGEGASGPLEFFIRGENLVALMSRAGSSYNRSY